MKFSSPVFVFSDVDLDYQYLLGQIASNARVFID
jgi:hypothetical protein